MVEITMKFLDDSLARVIRFQMGWTRNHNVIYRSVYRLRWRRLRC